MTAITTKYFDVSSVVNYDDVVVSYCVLELTNASTAATVKYRNAVAETWYTGLETALTLKYAYTGTTTKIAIISDPHIGSGTGDPGTSFTTVIDDIDDNVTGVSKVFALGDIVHDDATYYGTDTGDYKDLRGASDIADTNWHELAGNHDVLTGTNGFLAELLGSESADPYYTVTVGNCVFVLVSDDGGASVSALTDTELAWVRTTLTDNSDKNCFVMTHRGYKDTTRKTGVSYTTNLYRCVRAGDAVSLFCGHSHGFSGEGTPDSTNIFSEETTGQDLTTGVMYKIDEGTGTAIASDDSATDGVIGGACTWGTDGSEDYVDIPLGSSNLISIVDNVDLEFGIGSFSFAIRVKRAVVDSGDEFFEKQGSSRYFQSFIGTDSLTLEGGSIPTSANRFGGTSDFGSSLDVVDELVFVRRDDAPPTFFVNGYEYEGDGVTDYDADVDDSGATLKFGQGTGGGSAFKLYAIRWFDFALNQVDAVAIVDEPYAYADSGGTTVTGTGTAVDGVTESEIVTGGDTIILTVANDTWVATVGADNAITDALILGITSAQSETNGWNNVVRANMVFGDVARTSDTIVTITLAAEATYSITANETITITIPATALTAAGEVVATPTFDVTNEGAFIAAWANSSNVLLQPGVAA